MSDKKVALFTEDNFDEIERYRGVAMVRFSADWCKPCTDSEAFFDAAAAQLDESVKVGKVDTLRAPVLTAKYGIWGVPNVLIFSHGQEVKRLQGPQSAAMLLAAVKSFQQEQV